MALRPCSTEVARTINQSTPGIINGKHGQGLPLVHPESANKVVAKRVKNVCEETSESLDDPFRQTPNNTAMPAYPTVDDQEQ